MPLLHRKAASGGGSQHRVCDPIGRSEDGYTRPGTASIGTCGDRLLLSSGANREPTGTSVDESKTHPMTSPLDVRGKTIRPFDCYSYLIA